MSNNISVPSALFAYFAHPAPFLAQMQTIRGFFMQHTLPNPISTTTTTRRVKSARGKSKPLFSRLMRRALPLLTLITVVIIWQLVRTFDLVDAFLIPAPMDVLNTFIEVAGDGSLWRHLTTTFEATFIGLLVGVGIGVFFGYLIARIPLFEELLSPLIVALQSTPVVAYAPLLVLWFGTGTQSKIVTSALIVFFPMLMNTVVGIRGVPRNLRDLMRVSNASWWQTLTQLELPAAMPVLLTGLKTSATLAVIGAVVGEFIAARAGLGFLIKQANTSFNTPLMFVAVITLAFSAGVLYSAVTLMETRLLRWQRRQSK